MEQKTPKVRCAIYTRKSTDEGLEKEFNTLEAQREAGENYVRSQRHQGWNAIPTYYDDGGYTGGNMDRPALKRLIADVKAGLIDIIVVYKIDRLTRSLTDFSKLVEILDAHKCSFVSVTQNFNTADSMGRLTLNMLLSFAQFEREVAAERIRDKIAASRKKGMWMGGALPFGYCVQNKKLVIQPDEAEWVRKIFQKYLVVQSGRTVARFINTQPYFRENPEKRFTHARISYLLRNRTYTGKAVHKGIAYEGQHQSIIEQEVFDRVQKLKKVNKDGQFRFAVRNRHYLLKGLLHCSCCGSLLIAVRTSKRGRTYEYYTSLKKIKEGYRECKLGSFPTGEMDAFVIGKISKALTSYEFIQKMADALDTDSVGIKEILQTVQNPVEVFNSFSAPLQCRIMEALIERIDVQPEDITIRYKRLGKRLLRLTQDSKAYPVKLGRKHGHLKIILPKDDSVDVIRNEIEDSLLSAVVRAHYWQSILDKEQITIQELAERERIDRSSMARVLKLTCLAPDIIDAILSGTQPPLLCLKDITRSSMPVSWAEQRALYGFVSPR